MNSAKIRVKDPYHVIDKLVRKTNQDHDYEDIRKEKLHLYFDDLIGCRLIILYYEDWYNVNKKICELFPYSNNCEKVKPRNNEKIDTPCIIHPVEINIRNGDDDDIYKTYFSSHPNEKYELRKGRYYRSIHYTIAYYAYSFELQVRSIYDEAWGEVDHDVLYPKNLGNEKLIGYSKMLNRITGVSNEMSSYFKNVLCGTFSSNARCEPTLKTVPNEIMLHSQTIDCKENVNPKDQSAKDIIENITNGDII